MNIKKIISRQQFNHTPYIGWVGQKNLGDEILYEAHTKLFSDLNIFHFDELPMRDIFQKSRNRPLYKVGILGGGTLINQASHWLRQVQYLQDNNVNLFCMGTGIASKKFWRDQKNQLWKDESREWQKALSSFLFIGVRGPYAKKDLEKIGINNAVIVGDTALSLTSDTYEKKKLSNIVGINFGLVKSNPIWGSPEKYRNELIYVIKALIHQGYTIHLLPVWDKDIDSNIDLAKEVNSPSCLIKNSYDSFTSYSRELNMCDFFIGQKLHATIMANMNRIPSIMIEYDPKCREFMASIDLEDFTITTKDFSRKIFFPLIEKLIINKDTIQNKINEEVLKYKKIQNEYANTIVKRITLH